MNKEQFFDWLSGYFDICEPDRVGIVETQIIKDHIDLVKKTYKAEIVETAGKQLDETQSSTDLLNYNLESLSSEIKKSSGGRGRPTIPSPSPPPIKEPKTKGEIQLPSTLPLSSRSIC